MDQEPPEQPGSAEGLKPPACRSGGSSIRRFLSNLGFGAGAVPQPGRRPWAGGAGSSHDTPDEECLAHPSIG